VFGFVLLLFLIFYLLLVGWMVFGVGLCVFVPCRIGLYAKETMKVERDFLLGRWWL
jgi:hypothetical protein